MRVNLEADQEGFTKGIEGVRRIALAVPTLSVSLASACLAFEIYFLRYVYELRPGLQPDDLLAIIPVVTGGMFLITAVLCVDWVLDSLAPHELHSLDVMHHHRDRKDYRPFLDEGNGWAWRRRLFNGGYLLFSICLGALFFLLAASISIFLPNDEASNLVRGSLLGISVYYALLVVLKMMTNHLPKVFWAALVGLAALLTLGNFYLTANLMRIVH